MIRSKYVASTCHLDSGAAPGACHTIHALMSSEIEMNGQFSAARLPRGVAPSFRDSIVSFRVAIIINALHSMEAFHLIFRSFGHAHGPKHAHRNFPPKENRVVKRALLLLLKWKHRCSAFFPANSQGNGNKSRSGCGNKSALSINTFETHCEQGGFLYLFSYYTQTNANYNNRGIFFSGVFYYGSCTHSNNGVAASNCERNTHGTIGKCVSWECEQLFYGAFY